MTASPATVRLLTIGRSNLLHLEGLAATGSYGSTAGSDLDRNGNERGFVSYAPSSACSALSSAASLHRTYVSETSTIPGNRPGTVKRISTPREFTTSAALDYAAALRRNVCSNCQNAAQA